MTEFKIPLDKLDELIVNVNKVRKNRSHFFEFIKNYGIDISWLNIALKELKSLKEDKGE